MTTTTTTTNATTTLPTGRSPLDLVVGFYETVFSISSDETPAQRDAIKALIETAAGAGGLPWDGHTLKADDLFNWRESFLDRFDQMVFRAQDVISRPVNMGTGHLVGVAMGWHIDAIDHAGARWELDGISLVNWDVDAGHPVSNDQLGDAGDPGGWTIVSS